MSRITIVVSSPTLPMTRVSPAGIAVSQRTNPAAAGVPVGPAEGEADEAADAAAVAVEVTMGCAVGRGEVLLEDGVMLQAANASAIPDTASLRSTR
jgi:hypothetical protein